MRRPKMETLFFATLLMVGVGYMFRDPAMYAWMRHTGSISPHGTNSGRFMGKPGMLISVIGHTLRVDDSSIYRSRAAYHVLILFPADSMSDANGGSTTVNSVWEDIDAAWDVWKGDRAVRREFSTHYDGLLGVAEVAGQRYALKHGNLFVVHYDERGRPSVRQLRRTLREDDPGKAVELIQALLPGDRAVQDLTNFGSPAKPCPRRQAPAPARGAST